VQFQHERKAIVIVMRLHLLSYHIAIVMLSDRSYCSAIAMRLQRDRDRDAIRLQNDCDAIAIEMRLQCNFNTIAKRS
jgi:hypothetical protein